METRLNFIDYLVLKLSRVCVCFNLQGSLSVTSTSGAGNTVEGETENENNAAECTASELQEIRNCRSLPTLKLPDTEDGLQHWRTADRSDIIIIIIIIGCLGGLLVERRTSVSHSQPGRCRVKTLGKFLTPSCNV